MTTEQRRLIELGAMVRYEMLQKEAKQLVRDYPAIRTHDTAATTRKKLGADKPAKKVKGRSLSLKQRKQISERMTAYWAGRRKPAKAAK